MRVLLVEDDPVSRRVVERMLRKWGHEVVCAADGAQAIHILETDHFPIILSDWMMPVVDGVELCRRVRAKQNGAYSYFMLPTSRSEKADLVEGMDAGADDFIVKPFDHEELLVRIRAGQRILELEQGLREQNARLESARKRMQIELEAARDVQQALLPASPPVLRGYRFAWAFQPCTFVAGDIFNLFQLDEDHWAFYVLDVAGHGVASALVSVAVSRFLTPIENQSSLVRRWLPDRSSFEAIPPEEVVGALRERFPGVLYAGKYFTLTYAVLDTRAGEVTWVRAGHTLPLLVRKSLPPSFLDQGGGTAVALLPRHIIPDVAARLHLEPGDRFLLYTDGLTEARNPQEGIFSEERLAHLLDESRTAALDATMRETIATAQRWTASPNLEDDACILALERRAD